MTIASVRFYFYPQSARREAALNKRLWGFAEWFPQRLKPIREQLRGPEVKGVNIVNFMLYESSDRAWRLDEWGQRANTFEHDSVYDLARLVKAKPLQAIRELMSYGSSVALAAPWPQVVAVGHAMAEPLSEVEEAGILPFLRWPRGN